MNSTQHSLLHDQSPFPNETLQGVVSMETRMLIEDVIACGFQPIVTLLGITGNILSLIVLMYQGTRQTTNIILIGLALADSVYVLCWSTRALECIVRRFDPTLAKNIEMVARNEMLFASFIVGCVSRWFTCLVAVERFLVVQFPLKAALLLRRNRIIVASIFLWIVPLGFGCYLFLLYEVYEIFDEELNATVKVLGVSRFAEKNYDELLLFRVGDLVQPVFYYYIPILLVSVCTGVILRSLKTSHMERSQMSHKGPREEDQQQQRQVTKTLVSVCLVFLVTSVPSIVHHVARIFMAERGYRNVGRYENIHAVAISVVLNFVLLNSSVNFMLYIIFNSKFRVTFRYLFLRCMTGRYRQQSGNTSSVGK